MNARLLPALFLLLAACTLGGGGATQAPTEPSEPTAAAPTATPGEIPGTEPGGDGLITLRIWLPPQFSPDPNTPSGALLKARLDEFSLLHPGLRITVRVKAETGPGGLYESLAATSGAVPDSLPDLVLLPRPALEKAGQRSLLVPLPDLEDDWYRFGPQLAEVGGVVYGRPFAGDALVMLYRPDVIPEAPIDWTTSLRLETPFIFAAGDPRALFTLAQYQAAGGQILDENGRIALNVSTLAAVFSFYLNGHQNQIFPDWVIAVSDQAEAYQGFQSGSANIGITWASSYLRDPAAGTATANIPTPGSVPFTYVNAWIWGLSNPQSVHQDLSLELMEFLTAPEFVSEWTLAGGYLPLRPSSLALWPDSSEKDLVGRTALSATVLPPGAVLEKAGPAIRQALSDIFLNNVSTVEAAEFVAGVANSP